MSIHSYANKFVPSGSIPKATAKKIRRLSLGTRSFDRILLDLYSCYEKAKGVDSLSPVDHIMLECDGTDLMLRLLALGNSGVMQSRRYHLREQSAEEDDLEGVDGY